MFKTGGMRTGSLASFIDDSLLALLTSFGRLFSDISKYFTVAVSILGLRRILSL